MKVSKRSHGWGNLPWGNLPLGQPPLGNPPYRISFLCLTRRTTGATSWWQPPRGNLPGATSPRQPPLGQPPLGQPPLGNLPGATSPGATSPAWSNTVTGNTKKTDFQNFGVLGKSLNTQNASKLVFGGPSCLQTDSQWFTVPPQIKYNIIESRRTKQ